MTTALGVIDKGQGAKQLKTANRPRVLALDCEMAGYGPKGKKSVLIRLSIVARRGSPVMDCLVEPNVEVTDWRTPVTGISAQTYKDVQERNTHQLLTTRQTDAPTHEGLPTEVLCLDEAISRANALLDHAVIVGHDLGHDFKRLHRFNQSRALLRDTAFFPLLRSGVNKKGSGPPSLAGLVDAWFGTDYGFRTQGCAHNSVEDARAAMQLYRLVAKEWEAYAQTKWGPLPPFVLELRPKIRKTAHARPVKAGSCSVQAKRRKLRKREASSSLTCAQTQDNEANAEHLVKSNS